MSLTDKQKAFCQEYIKDHNGTQAAIRAGYAPNSAEVTASRLLTNAKVCEEIAKLEAKVMERNDLDTDRIVQELKLIAFSDLASHIYIDADTGSVRAKGWDEMPEGASRTIESIEEKRMIKESNDGNSVILSSNFKFKQYDKLKALEMLGKYSGMFREKIDISNDWRNETPKPIKLTYTQIHRMDEDELLIYNATGQIPDWLKDELERSV